MRILDDAHHQHKKHRQQNRHPYEPVLFGKRRKDKVLVGYRQEAQLRLSSLGNALAEHPSRAYRNLGLDQLITLALRIALGVHETVDPLLLVLIHELPTDGQHDNCQNRDDDHILPTQSGQKTHMRSGLPDTSARSLNPAVSSPARWEPTPGPPTSTSPEFPVHRCAIRSDSGLPTILSPA